jgi:hypothetical protein
MGNTGTSASDPPVLASEESSDVASVVPEEEPVEVAAAVPDDSGNPAVPNGTPEDTDDAADEPLDAAESTTGASLSTVPSVLSLPFPEFAHPGQNPHANSRIAPRRAMRIPLLSSPLLIP